MHELSGSIVLGLVPLLLLIEGFFSGSEIALLSADKMALRKPAPKGRPSHKRALKLASHPETVLSTTLLMTSLSVVGTSSLIALYFISHQIPYAHAWSIALTSPLVVLLGELLPKTFFQRHATRLAPWVALPVRGAYFAFYPLTRLLSLYTSRLSKLVGPIEDLLGGRKRTTREEIRSLLSLGKKDSELRASQRRMIKRIFDFSDTEAKHALIPLVRVDAIEVQSTVEEALSRFERHRHSRMPVFEDRIDNIIGILEVGDLLSGANELNQSIRLHISPAHYVAETQSLEDLMLEMSKEDDEMVVVVDEHGGAVGVLTFEDIIEEIVGEISDEYDTESKPFKEVEPGKWVVQARMEIEAVNELLKLELPQGDYETLSGFLLQQFGRIPELRDELYFNTPRGDIRFVVQRATRRHIETVGVEILTKG